MKLEANVSEDKQAYFLIQCSKIYKVWLHAFFFCKPVLDLGDFIHKTTWGYEAGNLTYRMKTAYFPQFMGSKSTEDNL